MHTEFESRRPSAFAERMYGYYAQLYLRHNKPIIPIAVFADDAIWRKQVPHEFRIGFLKKTYPRYCFHPIKLKNFSYRTFLRQDNPIGFALMATFLLGAGLSIRQFGPWFSGFLFGGFAFLFDALAAPGLPIDGSPLKRSWPFFMHIPLAILMIVVSRQFQPDFEKWKTHFELVTGPPNNIKM